MTTIATRAEAPHDHRLTAATRASVSRGLLGGFQPVLGGFVRARYMCVWQDSYWGVPRHDSIVLADLLEQDLITSVVLLAVATPEPTRVYVLTRKGDQACRALGYLATPTHLRTREPVIFDRLGMPADVDDPEAELRRRFLEAA